MNIRLNTSHVAVKFIVFNTIYFKRYCLNTSHVAVKLIEKENTEREQQMFKYISCCC